MDIQWKDWKDCKIVTVISPLHQGSKFSSCNRTFQGRTGWKKQCVKQPDCVKCYNEGMFGCEFSFLYSWKTINAFTITISIEWKNKTFHQ
jgi:hypothetical protein